jgi:hypothetical protein
MINFDRIVIDPTLEELDATLRAALDAITRRGIIVHTLDWPLRREELDAALSDPEGDWTWTTDPETGPRPWSVKTVHLAWWTDFARRRHFRVLGLFHDLQSQGSSGGVVVREWVQSVPLLQIYPESGFELCRKETYDSLLVVCACGAVGAPAEIGWMGTECALCHDRRAAGDLPTRPWDCSTPEIDISSTLRAVAFHPTQPILILVGNTIQFWNHATNEVTGVRRMYGRSAAWSRDGEWLLLGREDGPGVDILRADLATWEATATLDLSADELHFNPSGRWLIALRSEGQDRVLQVWDWPRRAPTSVAFQRPAVRWALSADERRLYAASEARGIHCHDLETGTATLIPVAVETVEPQPPLTSLHLTPDETAVVLGCRGTFHVVDLASGRVRHRQHVPAFETVHTVLQAPDRSVLVGFIARTVRQMHFLSLPNLDQPRSLAWYGPGFRASSEQWLAFADRTGVALRPWPPLLGWYRREIAP